MNNAEAYSAACVAGLGIIQVPAVGVRHLLEEGALVAILPRHVAPAMPLNLLYAHKSILSKRVRMVMDWLSAVVQAHLH